MGLIRRADAERVASQAVALDLSDLNKRGESMLARARAEADRIVAEARAERERLLSGAREEGFEMGRRAGVDAGHSAGLEAGTQEAIAEWRDRLETLVDSWSTALDEFVASRDAMLIEARTDVVRLAAEIARRVTHRVVELDPRVVEDQLREAISLIARPTRLRVGVSPDDASVANQSVPGLLARFENAEHIELLADETLERGSCVLRTAEGGEIDASIGVQLERIVAQLLPGDVRAPSAQDGAPGDAARIGPDRPGAEAA